MAFDPNELRDTHGRWTEGGAGADTTPDSRVTDVGGDKWNKDTAVRLENEYAAARPTMDAIAKSAEGKTTEVNHDTDSEDDEHGGVPEEWDMMSNSQQEAAGDAYKEKNFSDALEMEQTSWQENGDALREAGTELAKDDDWKYEAVGTYLTERQEAGEPRVPYTVEQLADSINLEYDADKYKDPLSVEFDDTGELKNPDDVPPKEQLTLPGIEPPDLTKHLTEEMRDGLTASIEEQFKKEAESRADKIEPPDYLGESAKEYLDDSWDQMDDADKFNWTKHNTDIIPDEDNTAPNVVTQPVREPDTYDPMNLTDGEDYRRTQTMAHHLFSERVQQIFKDRGIEGNIDAIRRADKQMWQNWKASSTSNDGQLMQVASADELGGRLRGIQRPDDETLKGEYDKWKEANHIDANGVDFDEFKKYWATKYAPRQQEGNIVHTTSEHVFGENGAKFTRLPDITIVKNGLASTSIDPNVANDWGGTGNNAPAGIDKDAVIARANSSYDDIGGYDGIKAMMRAKWETTQYMLDRADKPMLEVYRGLNLEHTHTNSEVTAQMTPKIDMGSEAVPSVRNPNTGDWIAPGQPDYDKFATALHSGEDAVKTAIESVKGESYSNSKAYSIVSDKLTPDQAKMLVNKYQTIQNSIEVLRPPEKRSTARVVVRAEVPRTAVLSVPAYGINIQKEREAVIAGTAWKHWEAYSARAPTYENVKPHAPAATAEQERQLSYAKYRQSFGATSDAALSYADWLKVTKPEKAHVA